MTETPDLVHLFFPCELNFSNEELKVASLDWLYSEWEKDLGILLKIHFQWKDLLIKVINTVAFL